MLTVEEVEENFMSDAEVADRLNVTRQYLYYLRKKNKTFPQPEKRKLFTYFYVYRREPMLNWIAWYEMSKRRCKKKN